MNGKISLMMAALVAGTAWLVAAEMSPAGEAMMAVRVAKAVKKRHAKAEQQQADAEKLAMLKQRYPDEAAQYESKLKSDPDAAKRQLASMKLKYYQDTGVDLDVKYAVKPQEGAVKRLKERLEGMEEGKSVPAKPVTPAASAAPAPVAPAAAPATPAAAATAKPATTPAVTPTAPTAPAAPATPATPAAPASQPRRGGLLRGLLRDIRGEVRDGRGELEKAVDVNSK